MNIKKSEGSYKLIGLIVILIIIVCGLIYYKISTNHTIYKESFANYSEYSKKYILQDCMDGWGKEYLKKNPSDTRSLNDICMSNAYLSNPKLLCGICGTDTNPLFSMTSTSDPNKKYYGCAENTNNSISLNWGDQGTVINKLLSDRMTCDTFNNNVTSGMYLYIAGDDVCTISLNDKVVQTYNGINIEEYFIDNVSYGDKLSISCKNNGGAGGLCFSYIWNKQIFILENNGYQNCANTIYYTTEGKIKWNNLWSTNNYSNNLLPWMKNWIRCEDGNNANIKIETFVGSTKNVELMNNDCVIFGSSTYNGDKSFINQDNPSSISILFSSGVNSGNKIQYLNTNYKKQFQNKYYEYTIKNVVEGDSFVAGGSYSDSNGNQNKLNLSICYLWCGRIFTTPRGDNFDIISGQIKSMNIYDGSTIIKYNLVNRDIPDTNILFLNKKLVNTSDYYIIFNVNNTVIDAKKTQQILNNLTIEYKKIKL